MIESTLLSAIGNTPLVKIKLNSPGQLFGKLEYLNPGGSVKDRSSLFMIEHAEKAGILKPGGTIVDASSGNHGIAVAMIGCVKGYKVIITVSEKISNEKLQTILAYGAEVVMCPATKLIDDPNGYHTQALAIHKSLPGSFMPNQYFNIINSQAHETLLGPEIWRQTDGKITHFFAGAGTGGTISGVGKFLKSQNPNIKIIAIDSNNSFYSTNGQPKPYVIEGIGIDFETPVLNKSLIDEIMPVSDDQAIQTLKTLSTTQGLLVGPSSGAVAYAAMQYSKNFGPNDLGVMIFGDSGRAYLSKGFYNQPDITSNIKLSPKIKTQEL
jgi:cystathionine beta-synthase